MDHTQKQQILPAILDGYKMKMREPRPVAPPTRKISEGLDRG
jgi:hypothetical protein